MVSLRFFLLLAFLLILASTVNTLFYFSLYSTTHCECSIPEHQFPVFQEIKSPITIIEYSTNNTLEETIVEEIHPCIHLTNITEGVDITPQYYIDTCAKSSMTEDQLENHKLCIVVAFRDSNDINDHGKGRDEQRKKFKLAMEREMKSRNVDYILMISEQEQGLFFNRGALMNLGFITTYHLCDYFIFHDVDLVPSTKENTYGYPTTPTHCYSSTIYWEQQQEELVGGVLSMTLEQYKKANGFSNYFWGWGYEDNDMYHRIIKSGQEVYRLSPVIGRYRQFKHEHAEIDDLTNRTQTTLSESYFNYCKLYPSIYQKEGLSNVNATIIQVRENSERYIHMVFRLNDNFNLL